MKYAMLLALLFAIALCCSSCGSPPASSPQQTTATQPPTQIAKPTPTATAKGGKDAFTALPAPTQGPTIIGQLVSNFIGAYGSPINDLWRSGSFDFKNNITVLALSDGHVFGILDMNADGNGWSTLDAAVTACRVFIPDDSKYLRTVALRNGTERVYISKSLASDIDASAFTDENGNQTTPGVLGITYHYDLTDTTHVDDCGPQVGLEGN